MSSRMAEVLEEFVDAAGPWLDAMRAELERRASFVCERQREALRAYRSQPHRRRARLAYVKRKRHLERAQRPAPAPWPIAPAPVHIVGRCARCSAPLELRAGCRRPTHHPCRAASS